MGLRMVGRHFRVSEALSPAGHLHCLTLFLQQQPEQKGKPVPYAECVKPVVESGDVPDRNGPEGVHDVRIPAFCKEELSEIAGFSPYCLKYGCKS